MSKKIDDMLKFQIKVVEETLQTTNLHVSTDAPVHEGDGEEFTLYDALINNDTPSPDMSLLENSLIVGIERIMAILAVREAEILPYYFRLTGEKSIVN